MVYAEYYVSRQTSKIPDMIGLETPSGVITVEPTVLDSVFVGDEIVRYDGELKDRYGMSIAMTVDGEEEYTIDVYDDEISIYNDSDVTDDSILDSLGEACKFVEKELARKKIGVKIKLENMDEIKKKLIESIEKIFN